MPQVSRRQFAQVLAGSAAVFAIGGPIALNGIVAPQLPRRLLVHGLSTAAGLFEFRVYGSHPRAMQAILVRPEIRPAWRKYSTMGTVHALRAGDPVNVKEISLYRVAG
jgi:hypothetical protein